MLRYFPAGIGFCVIYDVSIEHPLTGSIWKSIWIASTLPKSIHFDLTLIDFQCRHLAFREPIDRVDLNANSNILDLINPGVKGVAISKCESIYPRTHPVLQQSNARGSAISKTTGFINQMQESRRCCASLGPWRWLRAHARHRRPLIEEAKNRHLSRTHA